MAKTERKKIEIASVGEWKPVGKGQLLQFVGEDHVRYECWSKTLGAYIIAGETIEADIEYSQIMSNGTVYDHNKVTQIYVDGKPVSQKQDRPFQRYGKSPEEIESIEHQVRVKAITDLIIADKTVPDSLLKKYWAWLDKLGESTKEPQKPARPSADTFEATETQPAQPQGEKQPTEVNIETPDDLIKAAIQHLGFKNIGSVLKALGVSKKTDITDITGAFVFLRESTKKQES